MCKFELNFTCFSHNVVKDALHEFKDFLSEEFKSCVTDTITVNVGPNAKPLFQKVDLFLLD